MDNTIAVLSVLFTLLTFLASFLAPVIVIALIFRKLRPRLAPASATAPAAATPKRRSPWRWVGLVPLVGISLFTGLMITSIGGALHPQLTNIAAPMACSGGQFNIASSQYSYKPGQHGVTHRMTCTDPVTGERSDVTFRVLGWSTLIFSGIVFVPLLILGLLLMKFLRRAFAAMKSSSPAGISGDYAGDLRQAFDNAIKRQAGSHRDTDNHDVEDSLRELKRLRDNGLIDDADFAARKTAILARL